MLNKTTGSAITSLLNYCYEIALFGVPGFDSASALAQEHLQEEGTLENRIDSLIKWETAKCGALGLVIGLGGVVTLPISVPADVTTNFYVQFRMIAAIAIMNGYDPHSEKVKTLIMVCMGGNMGKEILKGLSLRRMGRFIPILGGVIGGGIDASACNLTGRIAKQTFFKERGDIFEDSRAH
jgi:hypothetical protein